MESLLLFRLCISSIHIFLIYAREIPDSAPTVKVSEGYLKGTVGTLPSGDIYYSYKGIPFALPPLGKLRFKKPEKPLSWSGVRDATQHGPACPQTQSGPIAAAVGSNVTSEDCLYLNVYTRNVTGSKSVMFWIPVGAFEVGSGNSDLYGPKYLLEKNVVLVTSNHRVGAFGFLNLDTADVPGNAGLKDQVMALKWVKDNIAQFGGNPEDTTIFGQSSGAVSAALHLVSPLSKRLFSKAIVQSGSSLAWWAARADGRQRAFKAGELLGKKTDNADELLQYLQDAPVNDIANLAAKYKEQSPLTYLVFVPSIEKKFKGVNAFIDKTPTDYYTSREANDVPVIIGGVSGEGTVFIQYDMQEAITNLLNTQKDVFVLDELKNNLTENQISELNSKIKHHYLGNQTIGNNTISEYLALSTDYTFFYPVYRLANILAKFNNNSVFYYYYTYVDNNSPANKFQKGPYVNKLPVASHGVDIGDLFTGRLSQNFDPKSENGTFVNRMTTMWTNFANNGVPIPDGDKSFDVFWRRFNPKIHNYLNIDRKMSMGANLLSQRMNFWEKLFEEQGLLV